MATTLTQIPKNPVALITGGGRGIGADVARFLASQKFQVVVNYREKSTDALKVAADIKKVGGTCSLFQADVSESDEVSALVSHTRTEFGPVSVLVHCAGPYLFKPLLELESGEFDYVMRANLNSAYYAIKEVWPSMKKAGWGRIIVFTAASAQNLGADPDRTPYLTAKGGLVQLLRSFAVALAPFGITVNAISPGIINNGSYSQDYVDRIPGKIPAGRIGNSNDIINALRFLLDPGSDYITGSCIDIGGGWKL